MQEHKYYVETSVWGMIPKGQPRELRRTTLRFLHRMLPSACFVSKVVLEEIDACSEDLRASIYAVMDSIAPTVLAESLEARGLAQYYVESGILPGKKFEDALHVAIATIGEVDFIVSWNHKHIANARKSAQYQEANLRRGYRKTPPILTPYEVLNE